MIEYSLTRDQQVDRIMRIQRDAIEAKTAEAKKREAEREEISKRESLKAGCLTQGYQGVNWPHLAACRACAECVVDLLPVPKDCTRKEQQGKPTQVIQSITHEDEPPFELS